MAATFDKILIPVDFSLNTEIAVKKAVELVGSDETVIHLLHIVPPAKKTKNQFKMWVAERDLHQWKYTLQQSGPHIRVKVHILRGNSVRQTIIDCASMLNPDLIIIAKQKNHRRWFLSGSVSPDIVAKRTNCPVLTVKPGSLDNRTRVIVLPIRDFLPERKLEWAVLMAKRFKAQVHLLAIGEDSGPKDGLLSQTFLKAYHYLREKLHHPVEYSAATRHNPAKAALRYAELIMADMILVNPQTESGISGFTGFRHISDLLTRDSKIQVLDVQPYGMEKPVGNN
ncbi:MAG TPA: universal stress protein [Puia sp.]|nr:universal stress protein [Puia sp.]